MSPEGIAHAIEEYLSALRRQAKVAEAFFYGRIGEGIEGRLRLPEDVRLRIDAKNTRRIELTFLNGFRLLHAFQQFFK